MSTATLPIVEPQHPRADRERCPFVGLMPFEEDDEAYFFGRDQVAEIIGANLRVYRLTIVYGSSGVGKSSVLRAAVIPRLRRRASRHPSNGAPAFRVVTFSAWRDDVVPVLRQRIADALNEPRALDGDSLHETLGRLTGPGRGDLLLILDQFEEYFQYHPSADDDFADELAAIINDDQLAVNVLISLRDDALAGLDRFKGRIPQLFSNYLRLEHLTAAAARDAVVQPLAVRNETADDRVEIEDELVDAVLQQVRTGNGPEVDAVGVGSVTAVSDVRAGEGYVEAPHLQIVMTRLWNEERAQRSSVMRRGTLDALGGSSTIIGSHVDVAMAGLPAEEQHLAADAFRHLVTPSGSKIALSASDLASYVQGDEATVRAVLEQLAGGTRILRSVAPARDREAEPRYEIFHDVLGPAVTDWRLRHEQQRALREERETADRRVRAAHRRTAKVTAVAVVATVLVIVAAWFAWRADVERNESDSRRLAATATEQLVSDPTAALRTALDAVGTDRTGEAEKALRLAISAAPPSEVLDQTDGWEQLQTSADRSVFVTVGAAEGEDDQLRVWHARFDGLRQGATLVPGGSVFAMAVSPSGGLVATGTGKPQVTGENDRVSIWSTASGDLLAEVDASAGALAFATDARLVIGSQDGDVGEWDVGTDAPEWRTGGHTDWVNAVSASRDGRTFVTASNDGRALLWPAGGDGPAALDSGYTVPVVGAVMNGDGTGVLTTDSWGDSYLFDTNAGSKTLGQVVDSYVGSAGAFATMSAEGSRVALAVDKGVAIYATETGEAESFLDGHRDYIRGTAFDAGAERALTASLDGTARIWDVASGRMIAVLPVQSEMIDGDFLPGGRAVMTVDDDAVRLWRLPDVRVLSAGGRDWALDAAFSPDATKIAVGNRSTGLAVWDAVSGERIHPRGNDDVTTYDVAFSPDGEHVATASTDRWQLRAFSVEVWSVATGEASTVAHPDPDRGWYWPTVAYAEGRPGMLFIFDQDQVYRWDGRPGHDVEPILATAVEWPDWIESGAVTPDGDTVLLALPDRVVAVDVETGRTIWPAAGRDERQATATSIVVDAVGARAALIRDDWAVDIVDPSSGRELATISRERQAVRPTAAAFGPGEGDLLIVGAIDGSTRTWRLGDSGERPKFISTARHHGDYVNSVQFGPDGEQVLSAGDDGRVLLWNDEHLEIDELIHVAEDRLAAFEDGDGS